MNVADLYHRFVRGLTTLALVLISPLAEKNPLKVLATYAPVILSMARIVVLGVAGVWSYVAVRDGLAGWPIAFLGALVVIALPLTDALRRDPSRTIGLAQSLFQRVGAGASSWAQSTLPSHGTEPSEGYTPLEGFTDAEINEEGEQ